ncbi:MAG: Flp pilus assembly protein CpaB [Candidatus Eremiobacteraeota bacterium]|nr:Flp pilus assembly protein CpaB [Candidatus Eremiobacteraeota bacterium]
MNNRRLLTIAGGAVAAVALFSFFALVFAGRHPEQIPSVPVVVAREDIPARTPLNASMFTAVQKTADQVPRDALGSTAAVNGTVSERAIVKDAVVESPDVAPASSLGLAVQLRSGLRAVSIAVDPVKDVSGLLHPGDRIDVIAVPPKVGSNAAAFTIMRNIRVLSVGTTFMATPDPSANAPGTQPPDVRTVTLEVTPVQANLLTMADLNSTLRLALRPPNEPATSGFTDRLVFFESTPAPPPASAPVRQAVAPARPAYSVPVIDGDRFEGSGSR